MNEFGELAYKIIKYNFKEDAARFPISYVSGWLETNLGNLNAVTRQSYSVGDSGNFYPCALSLDEEAIYTKLYAIHYYNKSARDVIRGVVWSSAGEANDDWSSIKEGDTFIQRQSKTSIAKNLSSMAADEQESLDKLVYNYNLNRSEPSQVYGSDADTYA